MRILFYYIQRLYRLLYGFLILRPRFACFGLFSVIDRPLIIKGKKRIHIGKNVFLGYKVWLEANPLTGNENCKIVVGDNVTIGHFNHIYATGLIVIEKDCLTADNVYISDNLHSYSDIYRPIKEQPIQQKNTVRIGEGSWLGENVCVIGAKIGKHCVIGANSVVTKDIPDYCVAVGAPARIIKQYDFNENIWKTSDNWPNNSTAMGGG